MADEAVATNPPERKPPARTEPVSNAPDPRDEALKQANDRAAAAEAKYANDMAQLQQALRDPATVKALNDQFGAKQSANDDGDETALVDRKELRKHKEDLTKSFAQAMTTVTTQSAGQVRNAQKELLRPKLKNFTRYESEIDAMLDQLPPLQASDAKTITNVYKVVESQHQDELRAERDKEIRAEIEEEFRAKGWTPDEIAEELETREESEPASEPARATPAPRTSVAPSAGAAVSRSVSRARNEPARQWQNRAEKTAAEIFGITSPAEFAKYGDPNWQPDNLGFRGRSRI